MYRKFFEISTESKEPLAEILAELQARPQKPGATVVEMRQDSVAFNLKLPVVRDTSCEMARLGNVSGEWVAAKTADPDRAFIYLHGGGYFLGSNETRRSFASKLSEQLRAVGFVANYRLAPENTFPRAVEDSVNAYLALLDMGKQAHKITIMGDSAGGGLTAATLLDLRDKKIPLPACGVLLSPWVDLLQTGESMSANAEKDITLTRASLDKAAKWYCGDEAADNPLVSPLYGDLTNLPPLLIQVGQPEILLDDSVRFADKLHTSGTKVELQVYQEMFHVWQKYFGRLPAADLAIGEITRFVNDHIEPPG